MATYIVLLRGINVGGNNKIAMKTLKTALESAGFEGVATYIQSGNIILDAANNPTESIQQLIEDTFGYQTNVISLNDSEFRGLFDQNPYAEYDPKTVHFYVGDQRPSLNIDKLNHYIADTERYHLHDNVFYLHAPNGIGRSKLVANIDVCLGTQSTGRNQNTMNKLNDMLNARK